MAGADGLKHALLAIKNVYGEEEGGEINQGLFIGLMKQYQMGSEAKRLRNNGNMLTVLDGTLL